MNNSGQRDGIQLGCLFQFLPILPVIGAAIFHQSSEAQRICVNSLVALMPISAILGVVMLFKHRRGDQSKRGLLVAGVVLNGVCPILGYLLMIMMWKIP